MKIDPTELRRLTETAIHDAKEEKRRADEKAAEKERRRIAANKARAETFLADLPTVCRKAALEGKNYVAVYRTKYEEHVEGSSPALKPDSVAGFVLKGIQDAGLRATVDFDHDGCGMESWHNITVRW